MEKLTAGKKRRKLEPKRHQWFDAGLAARGGRLKTLVRATSDFLDHYETHYRPRQRARKPVNQLNHERRLEAIVCNLAHAVLLPPPTGRIAAKLGHGQKGRTRYDSPILGKPFADLLYVFFLNDLLAMFQPEAIRGEVTSIAPSDWFAKLVVEHGVKLSDFGRDDNDEVIILSRNIRTTTGSGERYLSRRPINYKDNPETARSREIVRQFNAFLASSDIDFLDDGLEPRIDPFDRTQRRRFVILENQEPRFDQGGRLYGGFWQNLRSERRGRIRINGEEVVVLDFSSMFTRLAYAHLGLQPPPGDLYAIPGLEGYRSGVKLAMNCFLFDGWTRRRWPSVLGVGVGTDDDAAAHPDGPAANFEGRLPAGWGVGRTKRAILAVHPVLRDVWGQQLGYHLMFVESKILIDVLQRSIEQNIPILGLHDGVIAPRSAADEVAEIMARSARDIAGIDIPVSMGK